MRTSRAIRARCRWPSAPWRLAGCETTNERTRGATAGRARRPSNCGADGKYTIGMCQANVAEPYRQRMDDDIKAAAEEVPQFDVKFADAAQDNAKQVADVENYLTQQIDLLIISPNEAEAADRGGEEGVRQGHPGDRARPQGRGRRVHRLHRRRQRADRHGGRASTSPRSCCRDGGSVVELKGLAGATRRRPSGTRASARASRATRRSRSSPTPAATGCGRRARRRWTRC